MLPAGKIGGDGGINCHRQKVWEALSGFVLEAIQYNIQRWAMQQEFIARGLAARDEARRTGKYVSAEVVLPGLDKTLART